MTECSDIREAIASGGDLGTPEIRAHLEGCSPCRALTAEDARLGHLLAEVGSAPGPVATAEPVPAGGASDLDDLFAGVDQALARDKGMGAFLRSRATWMRLTLAFGGALVLVALNLLLRRRPDLVLYPGARLAVTGGALALTMGAALYIALRPTYRPPLHPAVAPILIGLSLALPFAIAALPMAPVHMPGNLAGTGPQLIPAAIGCFSTGLLATLPLLVLWLGLDRRRRGRPLLLAAGAAGLAANLVLELHCVSNQPVHLLAGHATVALVYVAGATVWLALRARR